ncbi:MULTISPECIES: metalloregulator ArsR/SmtB family transcription factor [unclassified Paraburkholderia]|uniref:ArsR/SmtB family transcription factor n=1 Tax=unclassified Paraburkholderia TaxID=2615204 RepID=UPI000D4E3CA3|nr:MULTISPECIES: metalloregulator ArsR/SmtB family transcription factor [unclassified Paraburkholderia]PRY03722.1 ArsR family transcriptional regulator [Paraburkholderia sp. BL25I1N1]REE17580.1 ArsR family transcriptional regulator [Paraburkholderia sp. BL27I4N3]RKR44551.1 ArsR family transcriptional regulator [Paraburkholderia sp. BL17N1]
MASSLASNSSSASVDDRSVDTIVPLADLFRLLGDPTRLRIVLACLDERRAVGAIAEALGLSSSLVSHHLRLLRAARIVRAERQGKQVFYLAADRHISAMLAGMLEHVAEPAGDDSLEPS